MHVRHRFWVETVVALLAGVLGLITFLVPDWLERLTGADPDGGDGSLELVLVLSLLLVTVVSAGLARREWRRPAVAGT
jgi:hypothetical protein